MIWLATELGIPAAACAAYAAAGIAVRARRFAVTLGLRAAVAADSLADDRGCGAGRFGS